MGKRPFYIKKASVILRILQADKQVAPFLCTYLGSCVYNALSLNFSTLFPFRSIWTPVCVQNLVSCVIWTHMKAHTNGYIFVL